MSKNQNIKQGYKHTAIGILPKDWEVVRLGEVGEIIGGGTPDTKNSTFWNGEIAWISSSDIDEENIYKISIRRFINDFAIKNSATNLIPPKSVLIISRVGVGKVAVNEIPLCTSQDTQSLIPKNAYYVFIAYLIKHNINKLLQYNQGTSIKGFTKTELKSLKIPLPPLKEQEKIARILGAWDNAIATLDSLIKAKQRYKKALMQRLLTPPCEVKTDKSPLPCGGDLGVGKIAQDKAKSTLDSFDTTHPLAPSAREGGQEASHTQKAPPLAGGVGVGYPHTNNNRNDESLTPSLRDESQDSPKQPTNPKMDCHESRCDSRNDDTNLNCHDLTASNLAMTEKNSKATQSLRFAGFTDKWQEFRLGDILQYEQPTKYLVKNTEYSDLYQTPVLTAGKTFILGKTNENFGVYKDLPVILFDDFMATSKFIDFPFKVKSSASKILKPKANNINLKIVFEIMQMIDFCAENHKRYWISEYQNLKIKLPTPAEQEKIAQVLSVCDKEIAILDSKLQCLKTQKRGLMQQLLSGNVRVKI